MANLARPFAVAVALATGALLLVAVLLWARSGFATPPYIFMRGPWPMVAFLLTGVTQLASGLVLALRRPDLPVGRLGLLFAAIVSLGTFMNAYLAFAEQGATVPVPPPWAAWLPSWFAFAGATLLAVALGMIFPDGRIRGRRWATLLVLAALGAGLTAVALAVMPGPLVLYPTYDNPVPAAASLAGPLVGLSIVGIGLLTVGSIGVAVALLDRYRAAEAIVRLQLRWYIASAVLLVAAFCAFLAALVRLPPDAPLGEAILVAFLVSAGLPPIALFVSITRYRLYDIDTILSRAFVFGALTAILAGVYTASIRLFNSIFTALTNETSDAALVITTLVLATSFTPIKRRLEAFVDRRFRSSEPLPEVTAATGGWAVVLDDGAIRRIAAAVAADPTFAAALEGRLAAPPAPHLAAERATPEISGDA